MTKTSAVFLVGMALLPMSVAQAGTHFTGNLGYETGGDDIVAVTFTDGSTERIKGGDGFIISGGVLVDLNSKKDLQLALTAGWKYSGISASNGDISLSRFPLEAALFKEAGNHRFGAGLVYHANIDLSGTGQGSAVNAYGDPTSEVGFSLQYTYKTSPSWSFGFKYTALEYKWDYAGENKDASSAAILAAVRF